MLYATRWEPEDQTGHAVGLSDLSWCRDMPSDAGARLRNGIEYVPRRLSLSLSLACSLSLSLSLPHLFSLPLSFSLSLPRTSLLLLILTLSFPLASPFPLSSFLSCLLPSLPSYLGTEFFTGSQFTLRDVALWLRVAVIVTGRCFPEKCFVWVQGVAWSKAVE